MAIMVAALSSSRIIIFLQTRFEFSSEVDYANNFELAFLNEKEWGKEIWSSLCRVNGRDIEK